MEKSSSGILALAIFLVAPLQVLCQAFTCYTEIYCGGGARTQATDFRECCLGPGLSYSDDDRCKTCTVIGWREGLSSNNSIDSAPLRTAMEQPTSYRFPVAFLKGTGAPIMVQVTPIYDTAVAEDILVNSPGTLTVAAEQDAVVEVNLRVDQLAMEPLERFHLRLDPVSSFGPDPTTEIFIDELTIEIIDSDNVSIRFTQSYFRTHEFVIDGLIPVLVERTAERGTLSALANPIVIRVVPVPYNVVNQTGFLLPPDFPLVDPYDPKASVLAQSGIDFNVTNITRQFLAGDRSRDLDMSVMIFNDDVDEVDEVFAVLLELVSAVNPDRVLLEERNASLCQIVDDDDIALSFELSSYTVSESQVGLPVYVVKEPRGSAQTEITYTFSVEATPVTGLRGQEATEGRDYTLGIAVASFEIIPGRQNFMFFVRILDDEDPEWIESFQLVLSSVAGMHRFQPGTFTSATVVIEDDDYADQAVTCYTEHDCNGSPGMSAADFRQCCLGPGLSYSNGSICTACVVIGWREGLAPDNTVDSAPLRTALEQPTPYRFPVAFLKGTGTEAPIVVRVTPIYDTAVAEDILVNSPGTLTVATEQDAVVEVKLRMDQLAMEPLERFRLRLDPVPFFGPDPATDIFIDELTIEIIDNDNVTIRFTQSNFRRHESVIDGFIPVLVERTAERGTLSVLANPIVIQVTPVPYKAVNQTKFPLPSDFPLVDPFDPRAPALAQGGIDFNVSIITKEFMVGDRSRDLNTSIMIFNDDIDEVDEVFAVLLELVSAVNPERVLLEERSVSLCRIVDDDDIALSFEFSSYTVSESQVGFPVRVVKEPRGSAQTEITYTFSVEATPVTGLRGQEATEGRDYTLGIAVTSFEILPERQNFMFVVQIVGDEDPEGIESFQLVLSPVAGTQQFQLGTFTTAIVIIEDNDPVEVGFVENTTVVSESIGSFIQTVSVFKPDEKTTLFLTFFVNLMTVDSSAAGGEDYVHITDVSNPLISPPAFSDDVRTRNITVEIMDDNRFEEDEVFFLTLSRLPSNKNDLTVFQNVSVITIQDDDDVVIGFSQDSYTFDEITENLFLVIAVVEGAIGSDITLSVSTSDGTATAGIDYEPLEDYQFTMSRDETIALIPVRIIHDHVFELRESFSASLSLVSPLSQRITVSPDAANVIINDKFILQFEEATYVVNEGMNIPACFTLEIPPSSELMHQYDVTVMSSDESAQAGEDYVAVNTTLTILGSTVEGQCVIIRTLHDMIVEDNETLILLANVDETSPFFFNGTAQVTIIDDEVVTLGFSDTSYQMMEGENIEICLTEVAVQLEKYIVITIESIGVTATSPIIQCSTLLSATAGEDFRAVSRQFTFGPGTLTPVCVMVEAATDGAYEESETLTLTLTTTDKSLDLKPDIAIITIQDSTKFILHFEEATYTVNEGMNIPVCFTLENLPSSKAGLEHQYNVTVMSSDKSAQAGEDYVAINTTFKLLGSTVEGQCMCVNVQTLDSMIVEDIETFTILAKVDETLPVFFNGTAQVTIVDNEVVTLGFSDTSYQMMEGENIEICVTEVTAQLEKYIVITVESSGVTATSGEDYTAVSRQFTFGPGTPTLVCVMVEAATDGAYDDSETLMLTLTTTDKSLDLKPDIAIITIQDSTNLASIIATPIVVTALLAAVTVIATIIGVVCCKKRKGQKTSVKQEFDMPQYSTAEKSLDSKGTVHTSKSPVGDSQPQASDLIIYEEVVKSGEYKTIDPPVPQEQSQSPDVINVNVAYGVVEQRL